MVTVFCYLMLLMPTMKPNSNPILALASHRQLL